MMLYDRRYLLHERLGAGGMGEVFRATDRLAGHAVALKRVRLPETKDAGSDASLARRLALANEFQTLASLRHPNVISVLDYGFDADRQPYFTMTLLEGSPTLAKYARGRPLLEQVGLLVQILRALSYLHRRGIVHRDLKPGNVLVSDGQVRVLDFGLSTARSRTAGIAGTLAYIAPEVLLGNGATSASDLYAVGVIAYELLAGRVPFSANDASSLIKSVIEDEPNFSRLTLEELTPTAGDSWGATEALPRPALEEPPTTGASIDETTQEGLTRERVSVDARDPTVAGADADPLPPAQNLVDVVRRLLAKRPERRYPDAASVIEDLSAVTGQPLTAETWDTRESFLQAAPMIGREDERRRLMSAFEHAREGRGRVLLVGGESGVGKSRLLDDIRTEALVRGAVVTHGQAVSEGGVPFQVWREPLRTLCLVTSLTDFQAGVLKPLVPDLETLLGHAVPDPPRVSADAMLERFLSVMEEVFAAQAQPTLVVVEDLHWARDSVPVLRRLARLATTAPLLVICSYRHDEAPTLPNDISSADSMILDRLSPRSVAVLTDAMLGTIADRDRIVEYLHKETEGNAFFLVEVVRSLAEEAGRLDSVGGMALPERVLSSGMRQLIERRLALVPPAAQSRLRLAAVLGRQLDLPAIEAASGGGLDEWLLACSAAAIVEVQHDRWRFTHDKLRETLLLNLPDDERAELHRQAACGIEAAYADPRPRAAELAFHWGAAGDALREASYSVVAGHRASDGAAYPEAARFLSRALAIAETHPEAPVELAPTERLLGEALFASGRLEDSQTHLERAVRHLGGAVPGASVARSASTLSGQVVRQLLHRLRPQQFVGRARTPESRARLLLLSRTYERMGHVHYLLGRSLQTVCSSILNLNAAERAGSSPELARSYATQIVGAGMAGLHGLARRYMALARGAAHALSDQGVSAWVDLMAITYLVGTGPWDAVEESFQAARTAYESLGDRRRLEETTIIGAVARYYRGRFDDSLRDCLQLDEMAMRAEELQPRAWCLAARIQAATAQGNGREALRQAAAAPVLEHTWKAVDGIWLYGALARCHLRAGDQASARAEATRALDLMPGTPPTAGYILEGYAGPAETWLALWESAEDGAAAARCQRHARRSLRALRRFAGIFPVGEPRAALCQGIYERIAARPARAAAAFDRSLAAAERLAMPYEVGLAAAELGRLLGAADPRGAACLTRAHETFTAIGAAHDARQALRALRDRPTA